MSGQILPFNSQSISPYGYLQVNPWFQGGQRLQIDPWAYFYFSPTNFQSTYPMRSVFSMYSVCPINTFSPQMPPQATIYYSPQGIQQQSYSGEVRREVSEMKEAAERGGRAEINEMTLYPFYLKTSGGMYVLDKNGQKLVEYFRWNSSVINGVLDIDQEWLLEPAPLPNVVTRLPVLVSVAVITLGLPSGHLYFRA